MTSKTDTFLKKIKPGCLETWTKYKILPSISAAQAILESGWGTSLLTKKSNNLFGIKVGNNWNGEFTLIETKEYLSKEQKFITINAKFRKYNSWNDSIIDHGKFLNYPRYKKAIGETNYKKAITEIKNAGYATDPTYIEKIISLISQYDLISWDNEVLNKAVIKTPSNSSTHKVAKGETLSLIAKKYGKTLNEILKLNPSIKDPNVIKSGQIILINKIISRHKVIEGETLSLIAKKYNTTVKKLLELNPKITNKNLIKVGQIIKLK